MSHSHHHHPAPDRINRSFVLGIGLNIAFIVVEVIYGLRADSLALLADAGHNLTDVFSLLLAWGAILLAGRRPTTRRTYGFRRTTNMASLLSSLMLLIAMGGIAWEAFGRLRSPTEASGEIMMIVAAVGVIINGCTAALFAAGSRHDLNIKAAFLHMTADAAVSAGVVLGGLGIYLYGWTWADPVITLIIVAVILVSTWTVLRDSINLAIDAVPNSVDPNAVRRFLCAQPGVDGIHDLHIWGMSTTETALTVHLVMPEGGGDDTFLNTLSEEMLQHYGINHITVQIEQGDPGHGCDQGH